MKRLTEVQTNSTFSVHDSSFHCYWGFFFIFIKFTFWSCAIHACRLIFLGGGFLEVFKEIKYLIWSSRRIPCRISWLNYFFRLLPWMFFKYFLLKIDCDSFCCILRTFFNSFRLISLCFNLIRIKLLQVVLFTLNCSLIRIIVVTRIILFRRNILWAIDRLVLFSCFVFSLFNVLNNDLFLSLRRF